VEPLVITFENESVRKRFIERWLIEPHEAYRSVHEGEEPYPIGTTDAVARSTSHTRGCEASHLGSRN
jgi:hypothetical protein